MSNVGLKLSILQKTINASDTALFLSKEFNLYKGNRAVTFLATRMQSAMTISYFRSGNVGKMVQVFF